MSQLFHTLKNSRTFPLVESPRSSGQSNLRWNAIYFQQSVSVPQISPAPPTPTTSWDAKNARRIELIRKNVAHTISEPEKLELETLQDLANERIRQLAPLPLRELEEFKQKLRQSGIVIPD